MDPNDPQRIITTTTTTTFTMTRDIAKGICQQFMDARLIENAVDPASTVFKDRGIYALTPKGLHVLERFITKNGIAADHLVRVFTQQPICMRLLHLERRISDDDLIVSRPVLEVVFRRFVGTKSPNYVVEAAEVARAVQQGQARPFQDAVRPPMNFDRSSGVEMQDLGEKLKNGSILLTRHVFSSSGAIDWLCDFSTCCCRDEAAELLAHFVRYGFISLHWDRTKSDHSVTVMQASNTSKSAGAGNGSQNANDSKAGRSTDGHIEAEFRWGPKVTYRVTEEGRRLVQWDGAGGNSKVSGEAAAAANKKKISAEYTAEEDSLGSARGVFAQNNGSTNTINNSVSPQAAIGGAEWSLAGGMGVGSALDSQLLGKMSLKDLFDLDLLANSDSAWSKEGQHSSTTRLRAILEDIRLRALFREYLKNNYCEENLGFWLDVQDFRRRFSTTSSAIGGGAAGSGAAGGSSAAGSASSDTASSNAKSRKPLLRGVTGGFGGGSSNSNNAHSGTGTASNAMEAHQNDLNIAAVNIYRLYLAPQSPSELNIDHNLRADVVNFITKCADEAGIPLSTLSAPRGLYSSTGAPLSSIVSPGGGSVASGASGSAATIGALSYGHSHAGNGSPSQSPDPNASPDSAHHMERIMILPLRATQVQTLLRYYERIQDHIFRLMATDQVPKFIRTPEFLMLLKGNGGVSRVAKLFVALDVRPSRPNG